MQNIGDKVYTSNPSRSESSKKPYMDSTIESRNKQRNGLCEENYSPNNMHLRIEIKGEYYPPKYDDPAQAQPIENKTYFQTLPQDEFGDSYEHKPRPPSGSSSSKKLRNVGEKDQEKKRSPLKSPRLCEENYPPKNMDLQMEIKEHELCNVKLSAKEREINRLKGIFDDLQRQVKKFKDQLFEAKSNLEKEQEKTERLTHQNQEKEDKLRDMRLKRMRLQKGINEFKQMHEVSAEREKKIVEQQTELERMCTKMGKFKKANDSLSEKNDKQEDRIRKLQTKLDHLERVGETHQLCVKIQDGQSRYIKELECEVESQDNNFRLLQDEYDNLNCSYSTMKAEVAKVKHLQSELDAKTEEVNKLTRQQIRIENLSKECEKQRRTREKGEHEMTELEQVVQKKNNEVEELNTRLEEFSKKCSALHRDKEEAHAKISALTDALYKKKRDVESLTNQLERIEDLFNKGTNLQKYKTVAEHKTSTLMNALQEKETEIAALSKQLARSEENVSTLSKDIKNIQEYKRQVAVEKLQDLQTENASLKLTLAEATTEIDDLWNKCINLQKYKSDTELEIRTLLNAIEEKETEIETLRKHLARSEKHVSFLSKDIMDVEGSERQAADENVQGLKTENTSLKSALTEATNEIDALRNKCTNLQKYKTDTEHTINTMFNVAKEKETESETLNRQLARKNSELSKDVINLKKDKENAANQRQSFSKALKEKEKEIEIMRNDIARYTEKISTLTKNVEDIKGSKNQAADENIKGLQKKIGSLESDLRSATTKMNDLSYKYKCLQKDKESAEYAINKLSNTVQEKEKEINLLIEDLARANENVNREEHIASANSIQKLKDENASLKSELFQLSHELRSVAGEKLRINNSNTADLSDENRPINLGKKFIKLYDDQWTDAIEHLEEMGYSETDGIRCLLDILKAVFDECVKLSDTHFNQLKELTGTLHLPSDQLKKLKALRKATAIHSVAKTKQLVNDFMSKAFNKEKTACQTYIDRSIELCWLMCVQDPPVVIDFIAVHGQAIDDKIFLKFTKPGSKIDFLVWPVIRLHRNGPLLQKGVVQPI